MTTSAAPKTQLSPLQIKLNGANLTADEMEQVVDVSVEQDLVLPDAFVIRFRDTDQRPGQDMQTIFPMLDADRFKIGDTIAVWGGREETPAPLLNGEITTLELDARADGAPILTVRGYDQSYKLHRERKSRTFVNVTDSDLVTQIARQHGLSAQAESVPGTFEHIFQDNLTDWEFLRTRADRIGYELFVQDRKLVFRKPAFGSGGPPVEVTFLESLFRLRMRLSAPSQVQEVTVKGWDSKTKREVVGTARQATHRPEIGEARPGGTVASRLGTGKWMVSHPEATTQAQATRMAQSLYDEIAGSFLQLEGTCLGDPDIHPGVTLKVNKAGTRFSGRYYVSAATHRISPQEGYVTSFVVSGRRPLTLTAALNGGGAGMRAHGGGAKGATAQGYSGVVVGVVTDNKPDAGVLQGQVKVKFPWLAEAASTWARLATPMAGAGRGFLFTPEINDEVLVAFDQGDINRPYVIGCLWNGRDAPPSTAAQVVGADGKVNQRVIKSRLGHTVTIDDSQDAPSITIMDKTNNNFIKLESQTNKLTAKVAGDILLEAQNTVTIKGRTVDVQAVNDLKLKGVTSSLEGTSTLNAKGATTSVEGTGSMTVKGTTTSVQGSAMTEVKGAIVRIN